MSETKHLYMATAKCACKCGCTAPIGWLSGALCSVCLVRSGRDDDEHGLLTVEPDRPPVTVEEMAKRWRRVQSILRGEEDPVETELETAQAMLLDAYKDSAEAQTQRDIAYRDAKNHQELAITWQVEARRFEQQRDAMEVQMAQAIVKAEQYREKGAAMQRQRDELRAEVEPLWDAIAEAVAAFGLSQEARRHPWPEDGTFAGVPERFQAAMETLRQMVNEPCPIATTTDKPGLPADEPGEG